MVFLAAGILVFRIAGPADAGAHPDRLGADRHRRRRLGRPGAVRRRLLAAPRRTCSACSRSSSCCARSPRSWSRRCSRTSPPPSAASPTRGTEHRAVDRLRDRDRRRARRGPASTCSAVPARRRRTSSASWTARRRPGTRRRCWPPSAARRPRTAALAAEPAARADEPRSSGDPRARARSCSPTTAPSWPKLAIDEAGRQLRAGRDALVLTVWQPFDVGFVPPPGVEFDAAAGRRGQARRPSRPPREGAVAGRKPPASARRASAVEAAPTWKGIVERRRRARREPDRARLPRHAAGSPACCSAASPRPSRRTRDARC